MHGQRHLPMVAFAGGHECCAHQPLAGAAVLEAREKGDAELRRCFVDERLPLPASGRMQSRSGEGGPSVMQVHGMPAPTVARTGTAAGSKSSRQ